uniref:SET domain-containing protein n=1 Tax=viral metagenome TaxID=1070528 RepID=A0A6C0LLS9_9ZZZZ
MTKIDCSKVYVDVSTFSTEDNVFDGAFANEDIKKNDLVEKGLMRRLSSNENKSFDGMKNPYVFTWSDDIPNYTWAFASGCCAFYNSGLVDQTNTRMVRYFDEDRFEIYATKDIIKGEELTHTYKSLEWRDAFIPLHKKLIDNN